MFSTPILFTTLAALQGAAGHPAQPAVQPGKQPARAPSSFFWQDYDRDGRTDAFVLSAAGEGVLLQNLGDGGFRDATGEAGLAGTSGAATASWQDVDADGSPDLLLAGPNALRLFLGGSDGHFRDASLSSGLPVEGASGMRWIDYDADGRPDLLLAANAGEYLFHNLGRGCFEPAPGAIAGLVPLLPHAPRPEAPLAEPDALPPTTPAAGAPVLDDPSAPSFADARVALPPGPTQQLTACVDHLQDLATGACLIASSVPLLGALYPLGPEFMIDSAGRVGIGTTTPNARLHVEGGNVRTDGRFISTVPAGPPLDVSSSALVENLNADLLDGLDSTDFSQLGNMIETVEIANNAVNTFKIQNGTIIDADVSTGASIAGTKIDPDFGGQDVKTTGQGDFRGLADEYALKGLSDGLNGPTAGYVGVQGTLDFDGVPSADWNGFEIGVAGVSTGSGAGDNYGVLGQSNGAGVRGAHSADPTGNFGELGKSSRGVNARGTNQAVYGANSDDLDNWGALGTDFYGVQGEGSSAGGKFGPGDSLDGVRGFTDDLVGYGVWGRSDYIGVRGQSTDVQGYAVFAEGDYGGTGMKYFVQPHPTDPLKEIRFVCLEGNESGTYFRGSSALSGGLAVIEVPEDFRLVTSTDMSLTVQVTVVGAPALVWVESKGVDQIVVRGNLDVEFDYFVNGVRRGFEGHSPIRENHSFLPLEDSLPFGVQYPESYRRILVENGMLNPDFTPNAATTALMEGQLERYRARRKAHRRELAAREAAGLETDQPLPSFEEE